MHNNTIVNSKICDGQILPKSLLNNSLYNCPICNIPKKEEDFHVHEHKIHDRTIKIEYLTYLGCKQCIDINLLYWHYSNGPRAIRANGHLLQQQYYNSYKSQYEQLHNMTLLGKKESMNILNIKHKSILKRYVKIGILQEINIKIPYGFRMSGQIYTYRDYCFYKKENIELLKYHLDNGHYYFPSKMFSYQYQEDQLKVNWPYILIGKKNKPIFFVNMTDKKKPCGKCLEVKNLDDFYPENKMKCGRKTSCKTCDKASNLKHYNSLTAAQKKEYYLKIKEWKKINKIKYKHKKKPESRIKKQIRHRLKEYIDRFFKENYSNDNVGVWKLKWTSCTAKELKEHLESLFQDGMSWDNYGPGYKLNENGKVIYDENGNTIPLKQWHVDHILPVSKFDLTNPEAIKHINHYKNLRPEWSNENLLKSNKIIGELINNPQIKEIYDKYIQLCHKPKDVLNVN